MPHMRIRLTVAVLGLAIALTAPALASAHVQASKLLIVPQGSAMAMVQSNSEVPLHFSTSAGQAIRIAETSPTLEALHRRIHPLQVVPYVWRSDSPYWYVVFTYHGKIVADAAVSPQGRING